MPKPKGDDSFTTQRVRGEKAAANRIKRLLRVPVDGIHSLGCSVAEGRYTNWEGGGRCRR